MTVQQPAKKAPEWAKELRSLWQPLKYDKTLQSAH